MRQKKTAKKAITSTNAKPPNDPPTAAPRETLVLGLDWAPALDVVVLESVGIVNVATDVIPLAAEDEDDEDEEEEEEGGIIRK